jgi:hypothetical protein
MSDEMRLIIGIAVLLFLCWVPLGIRANYKRNKLIAEQRALNDALVKSAAERGKALERIATALENMTAQSK